MSFNIENFKRVIDWAYSDWHFISRIGFLGGEPTLHKNFNTFLDYTLSKKFGVLVFTNGMVSDPTFYLGVIETAYKNEVTCFSHLGFCVNINEAIYRNKDEDELQKLFFSKLGGVSSLSFNIFEERFDPLFLFDTLDEFKMVRNIRLGLSSPLGNKNIYIKPNNYSIISDKLSKFIETAEDKHVTINLDCGFPACVFDDTTLKHILNKVRVKFTCSPVIDVYPDLTVSYCYPMAENIKCNLLDYSTYLDLSKVWLNKIKEYPPIYDRCPTCDYYNSICDGGCKAHKLNA